MSSTDLDCPTVDVLPMATEMAGVNMRLEVGAIRSVALSKSLLSSSDQIIPINRELHWHKTAEVRRCSRFMASSLTAFCA